jgi:predicted DNA-binding transcriptional regulator AlpA
MLWMAALTVSKKLTSSICSIAKVANNKGAKMTIPENFAGQYLRTKEAAKILGLSTRTLEKHRSFGTGPQFLKLGGRVVYKIEDLHSWALRGTRRSTSDTGQGTVLPAKRHIASMIIATQTRSKACPQGGKNDLLWCVVAAVRPSRTVALRLEPFNPV